MDLSKIETLLSEKEISNKIKELGEILNEHYKNYKSVYVVGILNGCFVFLSDIIRYLRFPLLFDFMTVRSYGKYVESSGVVQIIKDLNVSLYNKNVLVIEDIIDTRLSLMTIDTMLKTRQPREIRYCVLLDKPQRKKIDMFVDWIGFSIPDVFVVGYGLDYAEKYRNLSFIGILKNG
ncbi:MAG: hypoxanthine phosphoribosyltransferase [Candidatus Hydrogenedentota bacterium]